MARVTVSDWQLARACGAHIHLGKAFAFLGREAFSHPSLAWIPRTFGDGRGVRPKVVSLLGDGPVALPGATVGQLIPPGLRLSSVTSDKAIYREGKDEVRLLVVDALSPEAELVLELRASGQAFARHPVRLDARGAAALSLRDLPVGDFEARLAGAPSDEPACSFLVAEYRLAPLVASLLERRLEGSRLHARLGLEAFGVPIDGEIAVELHDRGRRLSRAQVTARAGVAEVSLSLSGEGPHAIVVQLVADPGRTATVPIVGSRAAERASTVFSTLGAEVTGQLLPTAGSRPVRGVYLEDGAERTSPFRLDRVDASRARLRASAPVEAAKIVIVDPAFPRALAGAIDVETARHPALDDADYQEGERLFQQARYADSRQAFERGAARSPTPHPNYAYYLACCSAKLGDRPGAVSLLRKAIEQGWRDMAHLASDDDLASLRGYGPYEALREGGLRELSFDDVKAGQTLELDVPGPAAIVAVGAIVSGSPWEGWAVVLAPDPAPPRVILPELPVPDQPALIDVETGDGRDGSVYVIVKDARLLSPDTPGNRLAGRLKRCAEEAGSRLSVGKPVETLAQHAVPPPVAGPVAAPPPFNPPPPMARSMSSPRARDVLAGAMPAPSMPTPAAGGRPMGAPMPPPAAAPPAGYGAPPMAAPGAPPPVFRGEAPDQEEAEARPVAHGEGGASTSAARPALVNEPEVLFAGLLEASGGKARVSVTLGHGAADYVVEAFALSGLDWGSAEARFRAEKIPSVSLELPAFVHPDDAAIGRLVARTASDRMRVRVLRDGRDVPLLRDGSPVDAGETLQGAHIELSFLAGPGEWTASVEDVTTGAADWTAKHVEAPGKLRRLAKAVALLEPGQRLGRADDRSIVALRVLPGLDRPFRALIDATSDYGHACCEQTAAKLLSACGMFALADRDEKVRARAEAIIIAGVRRERLMFLPNRGFKMYPESSPEPNTYYGPMAARYLWNLALLRSLSPSRALEQAIDDGLSMAADACRAYRIAWPPVACATCAEAYQVVRFSDDAEARRRAVAWVLERARADLAAASGQGAVVRRAEGAYAAAALVRGGGPQALPLAIKIADRVVRDLNDQGRLYSTVDSVAAIAMMSELRAAGVVGEAGRAEVDGRALSTGEAAALGEPASQVAALSGVVAVEVTRMIEEDWEAFAAQLPLRIALERGGRPSRRFSPGDAIDLRVTLEGGYKVGDLLWVCLPDALSRVVGGGQVKRFSIDFEGKSEIVVPLAATALTVDRQGQPGPQRFALCVRNMFEEERAGSPGVLDVTVEPPPGSGPSALGRLVAGLKGLFG